MRTFSRKPETHVVLTYKDDDEDSSTHQHSSLLPNSSPALLAPKQRKRACLKRLLLGLSVLAMCVGVFEMAFHGREAESLQAAKEKISHLEHQLSQHLQGGYSRVMGSVIRPSPSQASADDAKIEAVKSKSVIVLKTGATVLFDRLPVQLILAQKTIHPDIHLTGETDYHGPTFLIYSDADMQMGPFTVRDALVNVSSFVRSQKEFSERYDKLHDILSSGEDLKAGKFQEGWNLDKWKFLYMWEDAFQRNPDADWYIGYEADTFVLWESLFKYIATQDAGKEQMFGCGFILARNQELFANGGCPFVISGALMRATYGKNPNFAAQFDKEVKASCCGDAELSIALRKSATTPLKELADSGARFQREPPREILFDQDNWCQPVFSFHHLKTEQVQWMSQIEKQIRDGKSSNQTVLYSDVFDHILPQSLSKALQRLRGADEDQSNEVDLNPTLVDWEAFGSADKGVEWNSRTDHSPECRKKCLDNQGCTTWFWIKVTDQDPDGDCYLMSNAVRIGKSYEGLGLRTSGWVAKRIASFQAHNHCNDPPAV